MCYLFRHASREETRSNNIFYQMRLHNHSDTTFNPPFFLPECLQYCGRFIINTCISVKLIIFERTTLTSFAQLPREALALGAPTVIATARGRARLPAASAPPLAIVFSQRVLLLGCKKGMQSKLKGQTIPN